MPKLTNSNAKRMFYRIYDGNYNMAIFTDQEQVFNWLAKHDPYNSMFSYKVDYLTYEELDHVLEGEHTKQVWDDAKGSN